MFLDKTCLKSGEKWERGFAQCICNCNLVLPVISSKNICKNEKLNENSDCDNVLFEYILALDLNELRNTEFMPLMIGERGEKDEKNDLLKKSSMNDIIETVSMVRVVQASPFFLSEILIFLQRQLFFQVFLQLNFGNNRLY